MTPRPLAPPTRDSARNSARHRHVQELAACITERDQEICLDLYDHRVLTTQQVFELHFSSHRRARARLFDLYRLGVVDRIRPRHRPGSLPWHYILDEWGAFIVAAHRGLEREDLTFRKHRTLALVDSQKLRHLRGVNGFFSSLTYACRCSDGQAEVLEWWNEGRTAAAWTGWIYPDGYGDVRFNSKRLRFVLEFDRSTEVRGRLEEKLERYESISTDRTAPAVLFCFPTDAREASARTVLTDPGIPVATTTVARHLASPLGHIWLPLAAQRRLALQDLAVQDLDGER
jgi:hypothetical protein